MVSFAKLLKKQDFGYGRLPVTHRAKLWAVPSRAVNMEGRVTEMRFGKPEIESSEIPGWWAVYTRHQHEKAVADVLSAKGFEVFLPLYQSLRTWKDRKKVISLPLFPCYVLVRLDVSRRLQVVSTPGVHMILGQGGRDCAVPESDIEAIRRSVQGCSRVEPHPFLKCGERVRVMRGSLEGLEGILIRKRNIYRLILSVDMLAQSVAVELSASDVEPATASFSMPVPAGSIVVAPRLVC
jgi:transcription antitermination factor NusG